MIYPSLNSPHTLASGLWAMHVEDISLIVLDGSTADIILGRPWQCKHTPVTSWKWGKVLKWSKDCFQSSIVPTEVFPLSWTHPIMFWSTSKESAVRDSPMEILVCNQDYLGVSSEHHNSWTTRLCYRPSANSQCTENVFILCLPKNITHWRSM